MGGRSGARHGRYLRRMRPSYPLSTYSSQTFESNRYILDRADLDTFIAYAVAPAAGTAVMVHVKKYHSCPALVVNASDVRNNIAKNMRKKFPKSFDVSKESYIFWFNDDDPYDVLKLEEIKHFMDSMNHPEGPNTRTKAALKKAIQSALIFIFEKEIRITSARPHPLVETRHSRRDIICRDEIPVNSPVKEYR